MADKIFIGGHRGMGCTDHAEYAHRDLEKLPVENTVASVAQAFDSGADYVEIDAVMSADDVIFTLHNVVPQDHFFGESIPPKNLNLMRFDEIKSYRTGRTQKGRITPFSEMLDTIAMYDPKTLPWAVNIEIKGIQGSKQPYEKNGFIATLAETVQKSNLLEERVLFSSFSMANILAMSHLMPNARYGMLFGERAETAPIYSDHHEDLRYHYLDFSDSTIDVVLDTWKKEANSRAHLAYVHPETDTITLDLIKSVSRHGLGINAWSLFEKMTADRRARYDRLAENAAAQGVPLTVITDYIEALQP